MMKKSERKKKKEGDATEKHPEGAENAVGELFAECNMHHYKEHCAVFSNRINYSKRAQFRSFFIAFRCVLGVKSDELTEIKITEEAQGRPCFVS